MGFLFVALGGAIGSMGRYAISLIPTNMDFPILTLITNFLGAVIIGFIVGFTDTHNTLSSNFGLFLRTGVCGGFTTFSTFSLEAYTLIEKKSYLLGGTYILLSFLLCIFGVLLGKRLSMIICR